MRRRVMINMGGGKNRLDIVAGDILCAKANGSKAVFDAADYDSIPSSWTPIGVVAIPPSHNVYGTGEGAVVSHKIMSIDDPNNGEILTDKTAVNGTWSSDRIYFGGFDTNGYTSGNFNNTIYEGINSYTTYAAPNYSILNTDTMQLVPLQNYNNASFVNNVNNFNISVDINVSSNLPSDINNPTPQFVSCVDPIAYHWNDNRQYQQNSVYPAPSPYLSDGSRNEDYYRDFTDRYGNSYTNPFQDFNGKNNTDIILKTATAQSDWKTANQIINNSRIGYAPAACCCWRYHTTGTNQGDWYLPSYGEMGYYISRYKKINESICNIGGWGMTTLSYTSELGWVTYSYWTSLTTYMDSIAVSSDGHFGYVGGSRTTRQNPHIVVAFLRF